VTGLVPRGASPLFFPGDAAGCLRIWRLNRARVFDRPIRHRYPELGEPLPTVHAVRFAEIARRTTAMVTHTTRAGLLRGVMNTDTGHRTPDTGHRTPDTGHRVHRRPRDRLRPHGRKVSTSAGTSNATDAQTRDYTYGQPSQVTDNPRLYASRAPAQRSSSPPVGRPLSAIRLPRSR